MVIIKEFLLGLPRRYKRIIQLVVDTLLVWCSLWLALLIRLGIDSSVQYFKDYKWLFVLSPLICLPIFIKSGMYRAVLRYLGNDALFAIFKAITLSSLLLALAIYWYRDVSVPIPRSLVLNFWLMSLLLIGGLRLLMRQYFMGGWYWSVQQMPFFSSVGSEHLPKVAVYGAGSAGNQLVAALRMGRSMQPVAFLDDDSNIATRIVAGLKVYKPKHISQMIKETGAQEVLLAVPSLSRSRRREILDQLETHSLRVRTVPGFMDLATGRVKVDDLQDVDVADLLGREIVPPDQGLLELCIKNKVVMVTGAGGSIGAELCRQIIACSPKLLVLFEHAEYNLYSIDAELQERVVRESLPIQIVPILGSVRSAERLLDVMKAWRVETVYHAAAYKHVPMVEHNISEGVLNNVFGTLHAAQMAIQAGVERFVLISTDKAVRPTNVMGSSKRLAEMILQALSAETGPVLWGKKESVHRVNKTRFNIVRFGNVLGSSGSVIPLFREQIRRSGPVTVTHPSMTRYFMTIPEAAQLVIQAGAMGKGGEVFVLDMGAPVSILSLAKKMIHLSGLTPKTDLNPRGDIAIEFTGLRPGEKLFEELLIGDNVSATEHPMIMRANEEMLSWELYKAILDELWEALSQENFERVRQIMRQVVSGYKPEGAIVDWLYLRRRSDT